MQIMHCAGPLADSATLSFFIIRSQPRCTTHDHLVLRQSLGASEHLTLEVHYHVITCHYLLVSLQHKQIKGDKQVGSTTKPPENGTSLAQSRHLSAEKVLPACFGSI